MTIARPELTRVAALAAPIFEANGWEWGSPGETYVPDAPRIEAMLNRLYDDIEPGKTLSSGRFWLDHDEETGEVEISVELGSLPFRGEPHD